MPIVERCNVCSKARKQNKEVAFSRHPVCRSLQILEVGGRCGFSGADKSEESELIVSLPSTPNFTGDVWRIYMLPPLPPTSFTLANTMYCGTSLRGLEALVGWQVGNFRLVASQLQVWCQVGMLTHVCLFERFAQSWKAMPMPLRVLALGFLFQRRFGRLGRHFRRRLERVRCPTDLLKHFAAPSRKQLF